MRRSLYALFFQIPCLPEAILKTDNWSVTVNGLCKSARANAFTSEDIEKYKEAWSQPGAITSMLNWYRAAFWHRPSITDEMRVRVRTLILWGVNDNALSRRMARPSLDYCEDGNLIFFPEATHWVQRDAAEEVNHYLVDFLLDKKKAVMVR
jgi:pimeloyl-ACP methyl ester carboxylesterase